MKFNKIYFLLFLTILILEVFIEKSTGFIRFTLGDFFAVILVYALIKSFVKINYSHAGLIALSIAYFVEIIQLFDLARFYPEKYKHALQIIIGTSFSVEDLLAYSLGIGTIFLIEYKRFKNNN